MMRALVNDGPVSQPRAPAIRLLESVPEAGRRQVIVFAERAVDFAALRTAGPVVVNSSV
jgi:hypothetical protein